MYTNTIKNEILSTIFLPKFQLPEPAKEANNDDECGDEVEESTPVAKKAKTDDDAGKRKCEKFRFISQPNAVICIDRSNTSSDLESWRIVAS